MTTMMITTKYCEREYEHGSVEVEEVDSVEKAVAVDLTFVTSSNPEEFKNELQELVRKYAI